MADHPNAAKYRAATKALEAGRFEELMDSVADDVTWWMIGAKEPLRGKQALMELTQLADYQVKADLHDVVANDEHVVALINATATKDGRTFQYRTAEIHHIKDGKITERWAFSDDTDAINKFFA